MPNKKRIYEVAKELGRTSNDILDVLSELKISKKVFSAIEDYEIELVKKGLAQKKVQEERLAAKSSHKPYILVKKAETSSLEEGKNQAKAVSEKTVAAEKPAEIRINKNDGTAAGNKSLPENKVVEKPVAVQGNAVKPVPEQVAVKQEKQIKGDNSHKEGKPVDKGEQKEKNVVRDQANQFDKGQQKERGVDRSQGGNANSRDDRGGNLENQGNKNRDDRNGNRDNQGNRNRDDRSGSRDGQRTFNRDGQKFGNRDGQENRNRDGQRTFNRDGQKFGNREGQENRNRDGQRTFNRDGQKFGNRDGQENRNRDGQKFGNREGQENRNRDGQRSFNREGQENRNRDGQRTFNRDGQKFGNRDGQENRNRDGQRSFNREGQENRNRDGQRSFNREGQENRNREGQRSFNREGQENRNRDGQRSFNREGQENRNRDGQRSFNRDGQKSFDRDGQGFKDRNREGQGSQRPLNKDRDKDSQQGGGFRGKTTTKAEERKKVEHSFISDRERSDRDRERNRVNKKNYKDQKLEGSYANKEAKPNRTQGHDAHAEQQKKAAPAPVKEIVRPTHVQVGETINVKAFAQLIKREVAEVIKKLFLLGMMVTINQDIDFDTAALLGDEFGCEVLPAAPEEDPTEIPEVEDDPALRQPRPPVVTVMGHVDHGKTSLLDAIRKTNVTAREAGGITQHIGAYRVNYNSKPIVFLDTPGHEAFTAMRARGAQVTDVAVLVVAADDGVMPQTLEAINHAKSAKVPIIVAINKMDKPTANPDHVKQQLAERELIPEDWGGDTIMVPVSAYQKTGITDLLENIQLVAEMAELKANPDLPAHGTIIEAQLDKGRGPVATVLVQRGTLSIGDTIIAGTAFGKVRAMVNDRGEKVKKAGPSTPVEVLGLNDIPQAGDVLDATEEHIARSVAEKRIAKRKQDEVKTAGKVSLDDLFQRIQEGEIKDLNVVVKADVQGSVEAIKQSLEKVKNDEVKVVVVHSGVGAITESDVMLASAANALIIGFNVRPDANARKAAETEKVDMRMYRVIYDALNDVEAAIKGMLAPKFKEVIQGRVEVRQVIHISKLIIAGCYVTEGKVTNSSQVRVVRDGIVIHEGKIDSLRRFKDDVKEVLQGFECGLTLEKFTDIRENDQLEIFAMEEIKAD